MSIPGGIDGLFNIFEVDSSTMAYDTQEMAQDIATYGLFSYEEFSEHVEINSLVFDAFNGQYLKVAMGKGLIDWQDIERLLNRYATLLS